MPRDCLSSLWAIVILARPMPENVGILGQPTKVSPGLAMVFVILFRELR